MIKKIFFLISIVLIATFCLVCVLYGYLTRGFSTGLPFSKNFQSINLNEDTEKLKKYINLENYNIEGSKWEIFSKVENTSTQWGTDPDYPILIAEIKADKQVIAQLRQDSIKIKTDPKVMEVCFDSESIRPWYTQELKSKFETAKSNGFNCFTPNSSIYEPKKLTKGSFDYGYIMLIDDTSFFLILM